MNAETILSDVQLIDLNHRDAQFVRAELTDKINAALAAAVQAEREAIRDAAKSADTFKRPDRAEGIAAYYMGYADALKSVDAAIRARNGAGRK